MLDANGAGLSHLRLGAEGNTEASGLQHRQIVGAVADGQGVGWLKRQLRRQHGERLTFGLSAKDRLGDVAGELAVGDDQGVRAVFVETKAQGDRPGEMGETTRDEGAIGAARTQGGHKRGSTWHQLDALGDDLVNGRDWKAGEQRHTLSQRSVKGDFTAHGLFGDRSDARLEIKRGRQFVDTLLADHG